MVLMESASTITVRVPGAVWSDFLDPLATGMEAELELPPRRTVKRGKGYSVIYENVPAAVARELADYLSSRGELLLSNSDPEFDGQERGWYRSAIRTAEKITEALR